MIWDGDYVELGLLAPSSNVKFEDVKDSLVRCNNKVKPPATIEEWRTWFLRYAIVYTSKYLLAGPEMFGYMERIYGLYYRFRNTFIWRLYDEEFRKHKAGHVDTPWHEIHDPSLLVVQEVDAKNQNKRVQNQNQNNASNNNSVFC